VRDIMFQNSTNEIAENKLVLLYILHKIDMPITSSQLIHIAMEVNPVNYFVLSQHLAELILSDLIGQVSENEKQSYYISSKGQEVLNLFGERLSSEKKEEISHIVFVTIENLKKAREISAEFQRNSDQEYVVNLKATENDLVLFDLKVNVVSAQQAKLICQNWKNNSHIIFGEIINALIKNS